MESHNPCLLPFVLKRTASGTLITEPIEPEGSPGALIQAQGDLTSSSARGRHHTPRERILSQGLWDDGHHMEALENDSEVGDLSEKDDQEEETTVLEGVQSQPESAITVIEQSTPLSDLSNPNQSPDTPSPEASGSRHHIEPRETVGSWPSANPGRNQPLPNGWEIQVPSGSTVLQLDRTGHYRPQTASQMETTRRWTKLHRARITGHRPEHSSATLEPRVDGTRRSSGHMPSSSSDSTLSDQSRKSVPAELRDSAAGMVPASSSGCEQGISIPSEELNVGNDTDDRVSDSLQQLPQQMQTSAQTGLAPPFINPQTNTVLPNVQTNNDLPNHQTTLTHALQRDVLYLSHLIPRSYTMEQRRQLLHVFHYHAPYLPTVISMIDATTQPTPEDPASTVVNPILGPTNQGWPNKPIPTEVMEQIIQYLSRETIHKMRLVNREFERQVSSVAFKTVVVPFRAEIYGMMVHDSKAKKPTITDIKGKGKAIETSSQTADGDDEFYPLGDYCKVKAEDVYDGMKVFEAWGGHIKQFAMTFEIDQVTFQNPPVKQVSELIRSFWGNYIWPLPHYSRYDAVAGLEKKADESRCMTTALSKLTEVYELGLCVDSGLGWLVGPDVSDRSKLLAQKTKVFGTKFAVPAATAERRRTWNTVNRLLPDALVEAFPKLAGMKRIALVPGPSVLTQTGLPPILEDDSFVVQTRMHLLRPFLYEYQLRNPDLLTSEDTTTAAQDSATKPLLPAKLTDAQKEWLLETEWAQRAFLSSYCLALIDNSAVFQHVRILTIPRLSSRYLALLKRTDVWDALPQVDSITILVSPDWRNIIKSPEGTISAPDLLPSDATELFRSFLETCVRDNENIKTLKIGWADGGERAQGMCARNKHVLPAPVMDISEGPDALTLVIPVLVLPHVQRLTFTNCWFSPQALKDFFNGMEESALEALTLDSVSLTADHKAASSTPAIGAIGNDMSHERDPNVRFRWAIGTHYVCVGPNGALCFYANGGLVVTAEDARTAALRERERPIDPNSTGWLRCCPRKGSWTDVIDTVTPGKTLAHEKYSRGIIPSDDLPAPRQRGNLARINFNSCGYVRLINADTTFHQHDIGRVVGGPPPCLQGRFDQLEEVMLQRPEDHFLGQIVPSMVAYEKALLRLGFGMQLGWGDDEAKWENLEDGQPEGGSGRFSGSVEAMGPGGKAAS